MSTEVNKLLSDCQVVLANDETIKDPNVKNESFTPKEIEMTPKERLAFQILKTTLPPFQPFNTYA